MTGIALGCGTSGAWIPHIENIYDHENNTYIYKYETISDKHKARSYTTYFKFFYWCFRFST